MFAKLAQYALLIAFVLAVAPAAQAADVPWTNHPVTINVQVGGVTQTTYTGIPWTLGMTALDAMKMANGLQFTGQWNWKISGWFITSIAGMDNQAGGNTWFLCVNGFPAGVGAGSYDLGPGSTVAWTYQQTFPKGVCK